MREGIEGGCWAWGGLIGVVGLFGGGGFCFDGERGRWGREVRGLWVVGRDGRGCWRVGRMGPRGWMLVMGNSLDG